jgi:hypothetical protein
MMRPFRLFSPAAGLRFSAASNGAWVRRIVVLLTAAVLLAGSFAWAESKPKVLLLPFRIYAPPEQHAFLRQGLRSMFVSRLTSEGLDILSDAATEALLTEEDKEGVPSDERAKEIGLRSEAQYAIFGTVTAMGGSYSLDLGILDLEKDPPKLTRMSEATDENKLIPKIADVAYQFRAIIEGVDVRRFRMASGEGELPEGEGTMGLFFRPTAESYGFEPSGNVTLRTRVVSFDTGDLDGDGKAEIALVSRDRLMISSRDEDTMVLKDQMPVATGQEFLRVSVGDMNRDGKAEIYLVSLYGKRAQSTVYAWDGGFRKLAETAGHLNVVKNSAAGKRFLLYQGTNLSQFFARDIFFMALGPNNELTRKDPLPLKDAQIYTLAVADLNHDGHVEFLGLDAGNSINIWDTNGKSFYEGLKTLGGSNNVVEVGNVAGQGDLAPRTEINGRIIVADVDRDGNDEVIAARNIANVEMLNRLKLYKTSRLIAYRVEGLSLEQAWSTREIRYAISDLQKEGQAIYLAGQKGQYSKMSAGESRIMWFE